MKWIPNIPLMGLVEIALRAPSPPSPSKGLIYVEFQRLRSIAVVDIEVKVISEVADAVSPADWRPIEFVRIGVVPTEAELCRRSVQ